MKKMVIATLMGLFLLASCGLGTRHSDSSSFTPPDDYDSTKGQCNPNHTYPVGSPCHK